MKPTHGRTHRRPLPESCLSACVRARARLSSARASRVSDCGMTHRSRARTRSGKRAWIPCAWVSLSPARRAKKQKKNKQKKWTASGARPSARRRTHLSRHAKRCSSFQPAGRVSTRSADTPPFDIATQSAPPQNTRTPPPPPKHTRARAQRYEHLSPFCEIETGICA